MALVKQLSQLPHDILTRAIDSTSSPLILTDHAQKDEPIIYANQAFLDLCGYNENEIVGRNCRFLQGDDSSPEVITELREAVKNEVSARVTLKNYRKDGTPFLNDLLISPIKDDSGRTTHFVGMQLDITERKLTEDQFEKTLIKAKVLAENTQNLKQQKRELVALNKAKDEFISLASHQLRTPATSVKQYLAMLLEGYAGEVPDYLQVFLRTAYDSNERQLTIINDLLKTAQLDSGKYTLNKQPADIYRLIGEVISEYTPIITMRRQRVQYKPDDNEKDHPVIMDSAELKVAIANLLENASKYSPQGSTITVTVRHTKQRIKVEVADQGVGIAPEDQARVFEKFTRLDNELSDTISGSGLGLYFVRRIAKMHGGSVSIKSEAGKGSIFTLVLPL